MGMVHDGMGYDVVGNEMGYDMDTGLAFGTISDALHVGQDRTAFLGMVWSGWIDSAWSHLCMDIGVRRRVWFGLAMTLGFKI